METSSDRYIREHSTLPSEALDWIEKQTNIHTNHPRMLSGRVTRVLEIGTFTGYSATCLALGLPEGGRLDALEINDELEELILEGWKKAGVDGKISLHIGDARETLARLEGPYDLAFMDANKRQYCEYYEMLLPKMRKGGLIVADDVLWDGKVFEDPMPQDSQTLGVAAFNDLVAADPRVEQVLLPLRDGLNIIRII